MKISIFLIVLFLGQLAFSAEYQSRFGIPVGSGASSNSTYSLQSNLGDYSGSSYGGGFTLESGFLSGLGVVPPRVTTGIASNITTSTAVCSGEVLSHGGSITARGICWSTTNNPLFESNHIQSGEGLGVFSCPLINLTPNTTYYFRAYSQNQSGISYGEIKEFITIPIMPPTVVTNAITGITDIGAILNGSITDDGGAFCKRGFYYSSTNSNPDANCIDCSSFIDGGGYSVGDFSSTGLSGLKPGTTYYVQAFAGNSVGISYGGVQTFRTRVLVVHPPVSSNLALWLDPADINGNDDKTDEPLTGSKIGLWVDKSMISGDPSSQESAIMDEVSRQPQLKTGAEGINNKPAIKFNIDASQYGKSSILVSPYHKEITTEITDLWKPEKRDKSLFIVFKTGSTITGSVPYYETDHRETIFEAGGPISGFNMYINEGMLCFGMWNRFERKYLVLQGQDPFYPLSSENIYLASLEYNSSANPPAFRAIVSGYMKESIQTIASPWIAFSGLSVDQINSTDGTGIGGATRTSFHDYNIGSTYSNHFGGLMGDVMLYNNLFHPDFDAQNIYDFLTSKYRLNYFAHPKISYNPADWKVLEETTYTGEVKLSEAFPNPFSDKTSFGIYIPSTQNVKIDLYDAVGNKVQALYNGELTEGIHDFIINGIYLTNGMYFYQLSGNGFIEYGKVVLIK